MSRLFRHGDLRLYLLHLLEEAPRHGYDVILALETRFLGLYTPSPGTVYPRLAALEQEGLVTVSVADGRKIYRLTDAGRAELAERAEEMRELGDRVARSAREMAREIRDEVKASVRELRREVREAARDVRRDERRGRRAERERAHDEASAAGEVGSALRSLSADLESFVTDVVAAARRHDLDRERLTALREALGQARAAVIEALERR